MVHFLTTVKVQTSSFARERIVSSISVGPTEGLKPVKILHILIQAEVKNKVYLQRGREVDWIAVGDDSE